MDFSLDPRDDNFVTLKFMRCLNTDIKVNKKFKYKFMIAQEFLNYFEIFFHFIFTTILW